MDLLCGLGEGLWLMFTVPSASKPKNKRKFGRSEMEPRELAATKRFLGECQAPQASSDTTDPTLRRPRVVKNGLPAIRFAAALPGNNTHSSNRLGAGLGGGLWGLQWHDCPELSRVFRSPPVDLVVGGHFFLDAPNTAMCCIGRQKLLALEGFKVKHV